MQSGLEATARPGYSQTNSCAGLPAKLRTSLYLLHLLVSTDTLPYHQLRLRPSKVFIKSRYSQQSSPQRKMNGP